MFHFSKSMGSIKIFLKGALREKEEEYGTPK